MPTLVQNLSNAVASAGPAIWAFSLVLSSLTALVAVIVGPLIQLRVAKRQIRSTTISANRVAWIERLRDDLATIWARSSDVRVLRASCTNDPVLTAKAQEEARAAGVLLNRIRLSLNPSESDHRDLIQIVERLWNIADSVTPYDSRGQVWEQAVKDLMATAPRVLKAEWVRVKKGD
jgi:hypothetical protein